MYAVVNVDIDGKALRPLSCTMPQCMVTVAGRPVLEWNLRLLKNSGIDKAVILGKSIPQSIRMLCKTLTYLEMDISVCEADERCEYNKDSEVIVMETSVLTNLNIADMLRYHADSRARLTAAAYDGDGWLGADVILTSDAGVIERIVDEPQLAQAVCGYGDCRVFVTDTGILEECGYAVDLNKLLASGIDIYAYIHKDHTVRLDTIHDYMSAQRLVMDGCFDRLCCEWCSTVHIEDGAYVHESAVLCPPCTVGSGSRLDAGVYAGAGTVIGRGVHIGRETSLKRCVVYDGADIRSGSELRGAVICQDARLGANCAVYEDCVIGDSASIAQGSIVEPGVRIWPFKHIPENTVCKSDAVWTGATQNSAANDARYVPITPEAAAKAGARFASMLRLPAEIAVATDGTQEAVMLKYAFISGVLSRGVDVEDVMQSSLSAFRYTVRSFRLKGGALIRSTSGEETSEILLFDGDGANVIKAAETAERIEGHPIVQRLGVVTKFPGAHKAYIADLFDSAGKREFQNDMCIVTGGDEGVFDSTAEVLMNLGASVKYVPDADRAHVMSAAARENADIGFVVTQDKLKAFIFDDRWFDEAQTLMLIAMKVVQSDMQNALFCLPLSFPQEYLQYLKSQGAKVCTCSADVSLCVREAIKHASYVPAMFEPEAGIVMLSCAASDGSLKRLIACLPEVHLSEYRSERCSWKELGEILSGIVRNADGNGVEVYDGVKAVSDGGWAVVEPSQNKNSYRIVTGGSTQEYASELCEEYRSIIKKLTNR